ncbi:MAG TPA: tannase/feruloyl esterase family alpha/beta hydrolase [Candidatus Acidoferrales bacterium]|nr:tannase/feruloyl esterase family alpha/beta hydrolase [Candidatus Acidoferrales bacterium]
MAYGRNFHGAERSPEPLAPDAGQPNSVLPAFRRVSAPTIDARLKAAARLTKPKIPAALNRYASWPKTNFTLALNALFLFGALSLFAAPTRAADCATLANLALKDTKIASATVVSADGMIPEYCKVLGSIHNLTHSAILFEVSLPTTNWNGKYFVAGGGGYNGVIPKLTQALAEGYAAAGSDTGHEAKDINWALNNLDAQNNYAYLATHVVTQIGKEILRAFYAKHERRAYFVGCSNGGKMALAEIQRYPDDFDAAIAGDPVIDRTRLMMQYAWNAQALAAAPIPPAKIPVIEKATMSACHETGGAFNGLLMTPARCKFEPKMAICPSSDAPSCLTAGQANALQKILGGPVSASGQELHPGFVPGHEDDYQAFITGTGTDAAKPASTWALSDIFMRQFVFGAEFDMVKQFKFDASLGALVPLAAAQDNANADLTEFKARGGKLLMYHGWADHSITPLRSIEYYEDIIDTMGKTSADAQGEPNAYAVMDFARLFMVPGMHHCGNGPGPNVFGGPNQGLPPQLDAQHDIVMALDRWVEDGVAPEKIIASHLTNGAVDRTLALCPYPQAPIFNGPGDPNVAENYHCEDRSFRWAVSGIQNVKLNKPRATAPRPVAKPN